MSIELSICQFHEIMPDMQEMIKAHFAETGYDNNALELDPDYETYYAIEEANCLICTAARDKDDVLIGYSIDILQPSLHHKGFVNAVNDVLYVKPEYRGTYLSQAIVQFVGEYLKEQRVYLHQLTMTIKKDFSPTASECGYVAYETNWIKTLQE